MNALKLVKQCSQHHSACLTEASLARRICSLALASLGHHGRSHLLRAAHIFPKLIIAILLLTASADYCQGQPIQQPDKNSPLQLSIKSDKQTYEVGEEIKIIAEIKNASNAEVKIYSSGETDFINFSHVEMNVVSNDTKQPCKRVMTDIATGPSFPLLFKPGENKQDEIKLQIVYRKGKLCDNTNNVIEVEGLFLDTSKFIPIYLNKGYGTYNIILKYYSCPQLADFYDDRFDFYDSAGKPIPEEPIWHEIEGAWKGTIISNTITIEVKKRR